MCDIDLICTVPVGIPTCIFFTCLDLESST